MARLHGADPIIFQTFTNRRRVVATINVSIASPPHMIPPTPPTVNSRAYFVFLFSQSSPAVL
ncbi:Uncharacterized protein APZ42_024052 [Daphnia magna]|uniref:Uncharacterized protein n=1 Tax=Daphnia magna TaxID=35525 RepID=A0A164UDI6_9CRUS|nr:Uncharacterized protein APZ42_024052 [Daphnia magna]